MLPLPTADLRSNVATCVVPTSHLPCVTAAMLDSLPAESYDPRFLGQSLCTNYYDTPKFQLAKTRAAKSQYITIRLRLYTFGPNHRLYALSVKTEAEKWRQEIDASSAVAIQKDPELLLDYIPGRFTARVASMGIETLVPAVTITCHRYAVEDNQARLTLDVAVRSSRGKRLAFNVLEYKAIPSAIHQIEPPARILACNLQPVKLSKFLWATQV